MSRFIASFSGGKDSTAMVLRLLEEGWLLDEVGAYGTANGADSGNRRKERLWLSPYTQGGEFVQVQR